MVKTTVYLDEEHALALRRLARETGRPQAEIIREAVAEKTAPVISRKRVFKSFGTGSSGDGTISQRDEEVLQAEWGKRNS